MTTRVDAQRGRTEVTEVISCRPTATGTWDAVPTARTSNDARPPLDSGERELFSPSHRRQTCQFSNPPRGLAARPREKRSRGLDRDTRRTVRPEVAAVSSSRQWPTRTTRCRRDVDAVRAAGRRRTHSIGRGGANQRAVHVINASSMRGCRSPHRRDSRSPARGHEGRRQAAGAHPFSARPRRGVSYACPARARREAALSEDMLPWLATVFS